MQCLKELVIKSDICVHCRYCGSEYRAAPGRPVGGGRFKMPRRKRKSKKAATSSGGTKAKLTPYQGQKRTFGHFECLECSKEWTSANSWANTAQRCTTCDDYVYPYKQYPPKKGKKDRKIRHLQELCEMCQRIGFNCRRLNKNKRRKKSRK